MIQERFHVALKSQTQASILCEKTMSIKQLDPAICFERLKNEADCLLVDCRAPMEWDLTGLADLSACNKKPLLVAWTDNDNQRNPDFEASISAFADKQTPIIIMCRIGGRSQAACELLAASGFTDLTNMTEGFEGRADDKGHRNSFEGWRARGLPWFQS